MRGRRRRAFYDDSIRRKAAAGQSVEELFIDLALEDLAQSAELFGPVHEATGGVDGWVSMEVSPLLVDDAAVKGVLPADGGDAERVIDEFRRAGVDDTTLAHRLQVEGARTFDKAWYDLLDCIAAKSQALKASCPLESKELHAAGGCAWVNLGG